MGRRLPIRFTHATCTLGLVAASAALLGCPNPNIYGTPRTTPKGEISHTIAAEAMRFQGKTTEATSTGTRTSQESFTFPTVPSYQLRYGLAERVDLGASLRNLSTLGLDVKWNFLRERSIDMAVDPGTQLFWLGTGSNGDTIFLAYFHLPVLIGLNLSESFSIVLSPGATFAAGAVSGDTDGRNGLVTGSNALGRLGLGLNIRPNDKVHLHPELTAMRAFDDAQATFFILGFGVNFGALPKYTGEEGEEESKPATKAPAPDPAPAPAAEPAPAPAPGE